MAFSVELRIERALVAELARPSLTFRWIMYDLVTLHVVLVAKSLATDGTVRLVFFGVDSLVLLQIRFGASFELASIDLAFEAH